MLTDHDTRPEQDAPRDGEGARALNAARDTLKEFPVLEEPAWLEDNLDEEAEAPRDSAFRGIWIGVAAAAVTFVLVFAIPHWLGWYDVGPGTQRAKREATPESVIATVTAKSSGAPAADAPAATPVQPSTPTASTPPPAASPVAPPPVALPPVTLPKVTTPPAATPPAVTAKSTKPAAPVVAAAHQASKRTFTVQIAAFKDAKQAGRLAARVKRDGYPADVRRVESSAVPWVVRIGGYSSREQAESAREALARKGFRGFIL